jgi:single-strand DNA-binding protein
MVNRVILIGRLGADPESRESAEGKPICKFRMATDSGFGERRQTDWHAIVTFGKTADACAKYLSKGRQVFVEGRISYRKWQKDDGTTQFFTEIIANDVRFLSDGGRDGGGCGRERASWAAEPAANDVAADDIPF